MGERKKCQECGQILGAGLRTIMNTETGRRWLEFYVLRDCPPFSAAHGCFGFMQEMAKMPLEEHKR